MGVAGMVMSVGYDALWYPVCYACGYLFLLLFIAFRTARDALLVMLNLPLAMIGGVIGVFAAGGVLAMAMLEWPHFWIANGVFAAFVAGSLVSSGVKLAAYRRGF
jgi:hypothetical protein